MEIELLLLQGSSVDLFVVNSFGSAFQVGLKQLYITFQSFDFIIIVTVIIFFKSYFINEYE